MNNEISQRMKDAIIKHARAWAPHQAARSAWQASLMEVIEAAMLEGRNTTIAALLRIGNPSDPDLHEGDSQS